MKKTYTPDITRDTIVKAALEAFHKGGFTATSLNDILGGTNLTKGALYHHFANKKEVGIAVVEELRHMVKDTWLAPLEGSQDPISALTVVLAGLGERVEPEELLLGCPLNNLAQEMSACDEEFREHLCGVYNYWREGFARAFEVGKAHGTVAEGVDPNIVAPFLIASLSGGRGLAKTMNSMETMSECVTALVHYLESLRK